MGRRTISASDEGILIPHYQPSTASLHHNECPDMPLILALNSIWGCKRAHPAGHRHNRHIFSGKANIHIFDGVGDAP